MNVFAALKFNIPRHSWCCHLWFSVRCCIYAYRFIKQSNLWHLRTSSEIFFLIQDLGGSQTPFTTLVWCFTSWATKPLGVRYLCASVIGWPHFIANSAKSLLPLLEKLSCSILQIFTYGLLLFSRDWGWWCPWLRARSAQVILSLQLYQGGTLGVYEVPHTCTLPVAHQGPHRCCG